MSWAVVLAAAGTPHWLRRCLDGWAVIVSPDDVPSALASLAAYDQENSRGGHEPPRRGEVGAPHTIAGAVRGAPADRFCDHRTARGAQRVVRVGSADATRMMAGEWWRATPRSTLHADAPHLGGNAAASVVLEAIVRAPGPRARRRAAAAPAGGRRRQRRYRRCSRRRSRLRRCIHRHVRRHWHPRRPAHHRRPRGAGGSKSWVVIAEAWALLAFSAPGSMPISSPTSSASSWAWDSGLIAALTIRSIRRRRSSGYSPPPPERP